MGPYRVGRLLGSGGMGDVYLATDPRTDEQVALKVLRPEFAADPDFRRRFAREVTAAQRVQGRSIARVVNADLDAPQPWIASEYVPGETLRESRDGIDLRALAAGLARALVDIHAAGVVHRDLTPSNVILGPDAPKVVDFGIAWFPDATTITRTGMALGTPAWMAPEQLGDDVTTSASDVWAWGAVMAFAATGRPPVSGSRPEVIQVRASRGELDLEGVPEWLAPLVRRAMDPDPANRPTAAELAAELEVPSEDDLTQVLDRTWVLPPEATTREYHVDRSGPSLPLWVWRWLPGAVLAGAGTIVAAASGFLAVIIVVTALVCLSAGLRIWLQEREKRPAPGYAPSPGSILIAGLVTAGVGLAQVFGAVGGLVALVLVIVALVAIGAHGG